MKRTYLYSSFWSIAVLILIAYACEKSEVNPDDHSISIDEVDGRSFQKTSQTLYRVTSDNFDKNNFVISPLSIQLALYMVYNGADGETQSEIGEVLHIMEADLESLNKRVEKLMEYYRALVDEGHLDIHNALFYDEDRVELADKFMQRLNNYFALHKEELDFNSTSAVESINNWVQNKTYDKIKEVIKTISDQEVLFLINALYLKADWVNGFQEQSTSERPFTSYDGQEVMLPTMHSSMNVDHLQQDGYQVVRLPLADTALYTYLVMPEKPQELPDVINSEIITGIWNNTLEFRNERVVFEMPKFETETHISLNDALQSLGMTSAFDHNKADLRPMGRARNGLPLAISRTLHDVYFKMDERGVEGAAVTTIGVGTTSVPPTIQINKPFLYIIADRELSLPIFIGQFTGIESEK